jgi:hypothetical protein
MRLSSFSQKIVYHPDTTILNPQGISRSNPDIVLLSHTKPGEPTNRKCYVSQARRQNAGEQERL